MEYQIYALKNPNSQIAEIYRGIRTNIEFANLDKEIKAINITSTAAGEAKSTTAANLAVIFANKYKRVLLIDMDLRNPSVHRIFKIKNDVGLTNILIDHKNGFDDVQLDDYIKPIENENILHDLHVLTAGQEIINPTEVLESKHIKKLIEHLKQKFDFIIIDSSPSGILADGNITSKLADGTVYVVESGRTRIDLSQKTIQQLKNIQVNVLGVVITKAPIKKSSYGNYGDYYQKESGNRLKVEL